MRRRTVKRSRFSEEQIIAMLKEQEAGMSAADVCRKHGRIAFIARFLAAKVPIKAALLNRSGFTGGSKLSRDGAYGTRQQSEPVFTSDPRTRGSNGSGELGQS